MRQIYSPRELMERKFLTGIAPQAARASVEGAELEWVSGAPVRRHMEHDPGTFSTGRTGPYVR